MCSQIDEDIPPGKWLRIAKLKKKHKPTPPIKAHERIHFHPRDKSNVTNEFYTRQLT